MIAEQLISLVPFILIALPTLLSLGMAFVGYWKYRRELSTYAFSVDKMEDIEILAKTPDVRIIACGEHCGILETTPKRLSEIKKQKIVRYLHTEITSLGFTHTRLLIEDAKKHHKK